MVIISNHAVLRHQDELEGPATRGQSSDSWASWGGFGNAHSHSSAASTCRLNEIQKAGPRLDGKSSCALLGDLTITAFLCSDHAAVCVAVLTHFSNLPSS